MQSGLVLGAGGVLGASWLVGALAALEEETGWAPARADHVVGTSAGAVIGTLAAHGIAPAQMASFFVGDPLQAVAEVEGEAGERVLPVPDAFRLALAAPSLGPGSWRLALGTLRAPRGHSLTGLLCAWLPRGMVSTAPIGRLIERFVGDGWADHAGLRVVATDYATGARVPFGRPDAPPVRAAEAVAASCAIPGFYCPVKVDGRRFVDGGLRSPSNADLLCGLGLDVVVCLNPTSSRDQVAGRWPTARIARTLRAQAGRRLAAEVEALRAEGTEVVVLQPTAEDLEVMGTNLMSRARRAEVVERAMETTARQLLRHERALAALCPARRRAA
jgi:NTE family protein